MEFKDYEQIENNVKDIRFGHINIFMRKTDYEDLVMEIKHQSNSTEDYEFNIIQADQRDGLKHPSLLEHIDTVHDPETWASRSYFRYPNSDLFDQQSSINNPAEIMRFLTQMLEVLQLLKENKYVHGDIRPEYIYYNHINQRYILLDRLGSDTGFLQTQTNTLMYAENLVYMSPEMFEAVMQKRPLEFDLHKCEVFSLGMVLLSMFLDVFEMDMCYNRYTRRFDEFFFGSLVKDLKTNVFSGNLFNDQISDFLFNDMLCLDPRRRLGPRACVDKLKNSIAPIMLRELERVQLNPANLADFVSANKDELIKRVETESIENEEDFTGSGERGDVTKITIEELIKKDKGLEQSGVRESEETQRADEDESGGFVMGDEFIELDQFESYQQSGSNQMFYDTDHLPTAKDSGSKLEMESSLGMTGSSKIKDSIEFKHFSIKLAKTSRFEGTF